MVEILNPKLFSPTSESNSLSPQFFSGTSNVTQKGRPRKQRKPMMNQQQNEPLDLGTAMRMGKPFILVLLTEALVKQILSHKLKPNLSFYLLS